MAAGLRSQENVETHDGFQAPLLRFSDPAVTRAALSQAWL